MSVMPTFAWIGVVVFTLLLLLATNTVRSQWRGESLARPSSTRAMRGWPALVVVGWSMVAFVLVTAAGMSLDDGRHERAVALCVFFAILILAAMVAAAVVWALAFWTGRPAFAVPPALRRRR